jgi:predicted RNase H-like nuclease (RuvC/YqgF family)
MTILLESIESKVLRLERENAELRCIISEQARRIEALLSEVESLKKNSRNSSKPPSSDIVKALRRNITHLVYPN